MQSLSLPPDVTVADAVGEKGKSALVFAKTSETNLPHLHFLEIVIIPGSEKYRESE